MASAARLKFGDPNFLVVTSDGDDQETGQQTRVGEVAVTQRLSAAQWRPIFQQHNIRNSKVYLHGEL